MVNTVDINVGEFLKAWIVSTYDSDVVKVDDTSNLWAIVLQYLETIPADYALLQDRSEYISIELYDAHNTPRYHVSDESFLRNNTLYRCYIGPRGQAVIRRWFENQLRNSFKVYMIARYSDGSTERIRHAIGSFLADFNLPITPKIMNWLSKIWYRYRVNCPINHKIPIFF